MAQSCHASERNPLAICIFYFHSRVRIPHTPSMDPSSQRSPRRSPLRPFVLSLSTVALTVASSLIPLSPGLGAADENNSLVVRSTGPWGVIESYPVTLEPPTSHLWESLYNETSSWNFGDLDQAAVNALLRELGFSPATLNLVEREGVWKQSPSGLDLELTDAIIESLTPENRSALARWLRLNNDYFFSKTVINLEGGDYSSLENGRVSEKTLELVKRMSFKRRNVLSLMDRPYILRQLGGDIEEKHNFLRAIFATKGLMVSLVLDENTDLDAVIDYWSAGGWNREIESTLRGVLSTSGVDRIDLVQILPPVPRRYLYGFTNLRDVFPNNTPDCFWASIQFFHRKASPRLLDSLSCHQHLEGDFEPIEGERRFGDVVCMFTNSDDNFLHSYVHIADDIVFTKNGASFVRPFILTRKSDMLSVYLDETVFYERVYRRKPLH